MVAMDRRAWTLMAIVGALLMIAPRAALAAAPTYNLMGPLTTGGEDASGARQPQNGSGQITSMDMASGAFSGTAMVSGTSFQVSGTESGSSATYTTSESGYTAHDTVPALSVQSDGKVGGDGTFNDTSGHSGVKFWVEFSPPSGGGSKRASAVTPTCNLEEATGQYTCTAQVGDASGQAPAVTPTGAVTFMAASGGFPGSSVCTLAATQSSGGVASCSVTYDPPAGGIPTGTAVPVTASYAGDSTFSPSSGADQLVYSEAEQIQAAEQFASDCQAAGDIRATTRSAFAAGDPLATVAITGPAFHYNPQTDGPIDNAIKHGAQAVNTVAWCVGNVIWLGGKVVEGGAEVGGVVLVGSGALAAYTGVGVGYAVPAMVGGTVLAGLGPLAGKGFQALGGALANDPPDPHYRTLVRPKTVPAIHLPARSSTVTHDLATLAVDARRLVVLNAAMQTSVNRAGGAKKAHSTLWEGRQMRQALSLGKQITATARQTLALLTSTRAALIAHPVKTPTISAAQIALARRQRADRHLPRVTQALLTAAGINPATLRSDLAHVKPGRAPAVSLDALSAYLPGMLEAEVGAVELFAKVPAVQAEAKLR
jgi:hypothetical protein